MKKSLIALAFGTLGLGIAEFVMMGILPDVAKDLGISIPMAGHFISAYALGVCVGAPVLTLARKYPLKHILLVLVTLIMIGNICAATAPNYWILLAARFISGLPHGAYFGVGSIVAERLADKGKGSEAVSIMIAGMTIANLFGVPLGTSLSTMLSWRATFLLVGIWGIVILYYIWRWVPHVEGLKDTGFKGQFHFLEDSGSLAHSRCYGVRQRWRILLVQLYQPYADEYFRFLHRKYYSADDSCRIRYGHGKSYQRAPLRPLYTRKSGNCRTSINMPYATSHFLPFSLQMDGCYTDVPLHGRVVCRIQPRTNTDYPCGKRRRDVGGCLRTGRIQSGKCHWRLCRGIDC